MLKTYEEIADFRNRCVHHNRFGYYEAIEEIEIEHERSGNFDDTLYERIEKSLLAWIVENAKQDVYYRGDLQFEFESETDRKRFDKENGDLVAFKLTWS